MEESKGKGAFYGTVSDNLRILQNGHVFCLFVCFKLLCYSIACNLWNIRKLDIICIVRVCQLNTLCLMASLGMIIICLHSSAITIHYNNTYPSIEPCFHSRTNPLLSQWIIVLICYWMSSGIKAKVYEDFFLQILWKFFSLILICSY